MKAILIILAASAVLGFVLGLMPQGKAVEPRKKTVVRVQSPRPRRESVYKRVKRQQAEQRKAYHESEWRSYGSFGPW